MRPIRRLQVLALVALGSSVIVIVAAWVVDSRSHRGRVAHNVIVAGRRVGGMDELELAVALRRAALRLEATRVEVRAPGGGFRASVGELGLSVDQRATVDATLRVNQEGSLFERLVEWSRSFLEPTRVPLAVDVDRRAVERIVSERDPKREAPAEPALAVRDGALVAVAGRTGQGINASTLASALRRIDPTNDPVVITVRREEIRPRFSEADAERLVAQGERVAGDGLEVAVGDDVATVPGDVVRGWLAAVAKDDGLHLGLKPSADVAADLSDLFPGAGAPAVDAGFEVSGGEVVITPSEVGATCCAPEAFAAIEAALADPSSLDAPIELPLREIQPEFTEDEARALGIVEPVASFTTNHAADEPRVRNIHLVADMVRGAIIEPGSTFSINGWVGPRTAGKGFVEAPIISAETRFESSLGGGVSQFATTMFNAAFFAGLDITEYAMHGLYISRYPYGREATLSYPSPDLKVRNSTPYGVLVWPTYTASSITVTLYSTPYVEAEQTAQERSERGPCTLVSTQRTRRYLENGRTTTDRFIAVYAPEEGVECPR